MHYCGIDIGGTKIEAAIFNEALEVQSSVIVDTPIGSYPDFLETIKSLIDQFENSSSSLVSIGIGMPGLVTGEGLALSANVPCITNKNVSKDLKSVCKRDFAIQNDTRCFALSESYKGAGDGYSRVFGAIIGTGAAGGFVINGCLDTSPNGLAGEYGHLPVSAELIQKYKLPILICGCGLTACAECYISGPGIEFLQKHFAKDKLEMELGNGSKELPSATYQSTLECYLDLLGSTFASLVKIIDPDVIVLGGGVSMFQDIVDGLEVYIERHLFSGFHAPIIKKAKFGYSSGVRGAALLGMRHAIKQ